MYVLLLRIMGVGMEEKRPGSVALIVATICLFAFALHAIYKDLCKHFDGETAPDDAERKNNSQQETEEEEMVEIEVDVVSISETGRFDNAENSAKTKSRCEFLDLCAAGSGFAGGISTGTHGSDEVAALLAQLDAQRRIIRERDQALVERDAQIARFVANGAE